MNPKDYTEGRIRFYKIKESHLKGLNQVNEATVKEINDILAEPGIKVKYPPRIISQMTEYRDLLIKTIDQSGPVIDILEETIDDMRVINQNLN